MQRWTRLAAPFLLLFLAAGLTGAPLQVREAFRDEQVDGPYPYVIHSDRFVAKWGPIDGELVDPERIRLLLLALEHSYDEEVSRMGYPRPLGMDSYKMNVYVPDTGGGTPEGFGTAAFAWQDPEGIPCVAFPIARLNDTAKLISSSAHEFFHTIQFSLGAYMPQWVRDEDGLYSNHAPGGWWNEATASWIAEVIFPEETVHHYQTGLPTYLFRPDLALSHNSRRLPLEGRLPPGSTTHATCAAFAPAAASPVDLEAEFLAGHHYGAYIFATFLADRVSPELIRDSYLRGGGELDPLVVMDRQLSDHGVAESLADLFAEFAARNITLDYPRGLSYAVTMATVNEVFLPFDRRVVAEIGPAGTGAWLLAPAGTSPQRWGSNLIRMVSPAGPNLAMGFAAPLVGTEGTPARFRVHLVRFDPSTGLTSTPLPVDDSAGYWYGAASLEAVTPDQVIFLLITTTGPYTGSEERFPYVYAAASY